MQRTQSTYVPNTSAPRQAPHGDRECLVPGCHKKHCYARNDNGNKIYSRYCFKHTCAKVVTIEDGYHCPMAKVADQKYCDNHRACAAMNCNEVGSYPDDETKPWYCHLHRCNKDGCKDGAYDLLDKRCKKHKECAALQCDAPPDWDSSSNFCVTHTCNSGNCSLQAVASNRCHEHSKCGIPSCQRNCQIRPDGRLENLCDAHLQFKCAKPGCGGRKLHNHRRYCLDHGCRIEKCTNERHETGGTLCATHKCTFDDCFDPIADPDNDRSLFCATHACRQPDCLYSLKRPSSFCDNHTCKQARCFKKAADGPGSFCDAHSDGQCRVEGCQHTARGDDIYCKDKHGCIEAGCQKSRLSLRLGEAEEGEEDLVRCLRHDREWQANPWKIKYERLLADFEKLGGAGGQRKRMHATVEDTEDDSDTLC